MLLGIVGCFGDVGCCVSFVEIEWWYFVVDCFEFVGVDFVGFVLDVDIVLWVFYVLVEIDLGGLVCGIMCFGIMF